jgi:hypothetical protein
MKKFYILLAALAAMTLNAQEVLQGTINVGDFDAPETVYNGSYFDMAPTNFYIAHTGAQMLYTPAELADLQDKANVKVTKLTFKFLCEDYKTYTRDIKVSLKAIDETEFAVNDQGIKQFFNFDAPQLEFEWSCDMVDYYYDDGEIVFDLTNNPFSLEAGKTLLVTAIFDAQDDDNCTMGSDYVPFYTSGISSKAMVYTNNWTSFVEYAQGDDFPDATAMLGCGTNVELPVTKIDYTYEEQEEPQVYFLTGTFNRWGEQGAAPNIEFMEDEDGNLTASVNLVANDRFKVITTDESGETIWYGGTVTNPDDETDYFWVTEELLGSGLTIFPGPEYHDFIVFEDGKYKLYLSPALGKSPASSLILTVTKEEDVPTAVTDINVDNIASVKYVNLAGQVSATPFDGVNIQVTTMKDGSKKAVKMIR